MVYVHSPHCDMYGCSSFSLYNLIGCGLSNFSFIDASYDIIELNNWFNLRSYVEYLPKEKHIDIPDHYTKENIG